MAEHDGTAPGQGAHVLIVEDDPGNRHAASQFLRRRGYRVSEASDGTEVVARLAAEPADLVLLDLGLPGVDGLDLLADLRRSSEVAVIIASARGSESDRIRGLDLGADDYLAKPFSLSELDSRIRAVLRRGRPTAQEDVLATGGLVIDTAERTVTVDGRPVSLTRREFDVLAFLAQRPGRVFSRDDLLAQVWGSSESWQRASTVTEHVRRIRLKIEADPERPRYITTVRGVGYRFERALSSSPAGS